MDFIKQIINGLSIGSIYALVALGYTMVYGIVKLINFAHGDIIMVGSYIILLCTASLGLPFWAATLLAMAACALVGVLSERIAYRPLRKAPRISALITAIGVSLLLQNLFMLLFSSDPRPFKGGISGDISLLGFTISNNTIITIGVSILLMVLLTLFVRKTRLGKAMRAVSEDEGAARLMGINVDNTISVTFAVGSALAAVAGALYISAYPSVEPYMGAMFGLKAFVAAVLGGIGIIPGAMVGGFVIGLAESLTKSVASRWSDAIVFGILIVVLLIKPSGILGKNVKEKV